MFRCTSDFKFPTRTAANRSAVQVYLRLKISHQNCCQPFSCSGVPQTSNFPPELLPTVQLFRCTSDFIVPTRTAANPVACSSVTNHQSPILFNIISRTKIFFAQVMGLFWRNKCGPCMSVCGPLHTLPSPPHGSLPRQMPLEIKSHISLSGRC
jgi:hypothetical protein